MPQTHITEIAGFPAYRVSGNGGETHRFSARDAYAAKDSLRRWDERHEAAYQEALSCVQDPGDRMPHTWTPPRIRSR